MLLEVSLSIRVTIASFLLYLFSWIVYCRYFHPLRSIPGPFLASISRSWIVYKTMTGDMEQTQRTLHKRYGYLVRIAPHEVACSDPEAIKVIYGTKSLFTKSDFYDAWAPPSKGYVGHFPARDEKLHAERRRIVNNVYSMSSVLENERAIDSCTEQFSEAMSDFAKRGEVFDLSIWINRYAFDVLGELFYGRKFGFMQERIDVGGYMEAIDSLLPAFTIGGTLPACLTLPYLVLAIGFSSSVRRAMTAVKQLETASNTAVSQRKQDMEVNKDKRRDLLGKMIEIHLEHGQKIGFSDADVRVESHSSIFAGSDTTAAAINSILYHLMRNPEFYVRLTEEIEEAIKIGVLSSPITYAQAIELPYLKACINEGMRLHPSVGLTMPRVVPAGGVLISGFHFPAGYRVGVNSAVVQYDQQIFGRDADEFNPDRWIENDTVQMDRTMLQFGAGARTCLGKNEQISLSEIYKLVPHLVWNFHLKLARPHEQWTTKNYWFNKQSNINVLIEKRVR